MDFKFSSLLGAPYRGGNLLIHDNELLTPVGNRVTQVRCPSMFSEGCGLRKRTGLRRRAWHAPHLRRAPLLSPRRST